jgi:hypothetical protein
VWGLVAGVLLAALAVWVAIDPILRPRAPAPPVDEGADPDDDLSPRAVALRALSEIEFDRATGKLSPEDYESLKARYTRDAVTALREGDRGAISSGALPERPAAPKPASTPVLPLVAKPAAGSGLACPVHGVRPEGGSAFCSECGRRVGTGAQDRFCTKCGTLLEPDSSFCGRCGSRVAA